MRRIKTPNSGRERTTLSGTNLVETGQETPEAKTVITITPNICEQKDVCPICARGGYFGLPLPFILHHPDKSITTVCYRCATQAGKKACKKIPASESDIFAAIEAKDMILIRKARQKIDIKEGTYK